MLRQNIKPGLSLSKLKSATALHIFNINFFQVEPMLFKPTLPVQLKSTYPEEILRSVYLALLVE